LSPEIINPSLLKSNLNTRFIGQRVLYFQQVTSTNEIARKEAMKHSSEGTAVIAERQTTGRGRLKRSWITIEGNIAVSIVLYPPKRCLNNITMLASLAAAEAIESVAGIECTLKWPNDVLIRGRKVSGILIETSIRSDRAHYVIIGTGINVHMQTDGYPEISSTATSLDRESAIRVSREVLLCRLFETTEKLYLGLLSGVSLVNRWRERLSTLGEQVCVRSGDDVFEGVAESVADDGSLMLRTKDGSMIKFMAADVTLRE